VQLVVRPSRFAREVSIAIFRTRQLVGDTGGHLQLIVRRLREAPGVPRLTANRPRGIVRSQSAVAATRLKITVGLCLLAGAAAIAVTLSKSPLTVAAVNTTATAQLGKTSHTTAACQSGETLPRGTSAIRLRVFAFLGPRVTVQVRAHGQVIAHGERGSGWTSGAVTVPVKPLATTRSGVDLCFTFFTDGNEDDWYVGEPTGARAVQGGVGPPHGRVRVEYMRPGSASWWSLALTVARRMGLGRAWPGTWVVLLLLALMGSVVVLCSVVLSRAPPR
jgi:hypothetical protein